jgi:hypothetical protein
MGLGIAVKAFFAALGNRQKAELIEQALGGQSPATAADMVKRIPEQPAKPAAPAPARDTAVTLLATLQREARLVDLIKEDLSQYSDAQVGAAARPCLQQCSGVLDRLLGLKPLVAAADGDTVDVEPNASPTRYQWIGEGTAAAGKLVHHGWHATKIELPKWTGDAADANIIAAAQIQAQ